MLYRRFESRRRVARDRVDQGRITASACPLERDGVLARGHHEDRRCVAGIGRAGRRDGYRSHPVAVDQHVQRLVRSVGLRLGGEKAELVAARREGNGLADAAVALDEADLEPLGRRPIPVGVGAALLFRVFKEYLG